MCKNSLVVKNPSLLLSMEQEGNTNGFNYIPFYSRASMIVPCGYCLQCQELKSKEWRLRLRYEFDFVNKNNGYVFKDELTYSDDKVSKIGNFMVFNKEHLRQFFKLLRIRIERWCKKRDIPCVKIKYFVCCEYGGKYTHRPHYHILVFVYDKNLSYLTLHHLIAECWQYGFTNFNKGRNKKANWSPHNKVVKSFAGVEYVTKYLFKDKSFFDGLINQSDKVVANYICKHLDMTLLELNAKLLVDDTLFAHVVKLLRKSVFVNSIPFRMQSQGIGISMLSKISFDDAVSGVFNDVLSSKLQHIPMYYKRKLLYDYNHITRCFVKSEQYIDWLWNNEKNSQVDFWQFVGDDIPESIKFPLLSYGYDGSQLYRCYRLFTILKDICPFDYLPCNFGYPYEVDNSFNHIIYLFKQRDLFYSSILRTTFNVNDIWTEVDSQDIFDSDMYIQSHIVERTRCDDAMTLAFLNLDAWLRQHRDYKGKLICDQIFQKYVANKYHYDE